MRLLWYEGRVLASSGGTSVQCNEGYVPLISNDGLHQLQSMYVDIVLTMMLGRVKGHELVIYVLYHLHVWTVSNPRDQSLVAAASLYERLLLEVAKSLLDTLSVSDKSFSRLLGDALVLIDFCIRYCGCIALSHPNKVRRSTTTTRLVYIALALYCGSY